MNKLIPAVVLLLLSIAGYAQDDLLKELDSTQVKEKNYATAAFKGLQVVTLQSTKMPAAKEWYFLVSHRFGTLKNGINTFFGLDNATTKLGGVYGITNWLSVSASRHTLLKTYETSVKYRIARQSDDFPVDIVGYNTLDINSLLDKKNYPKIQFGDRLTYVNQVLISRKFSEKLSLELVPSYIHKGLYNPATENADQFTLGAGGRMKLTKRMSVNLEYAYNFDKPGFYTNPLSAALDIDTGGHIFQLVFTSSQAMTESGYLTNGAGHWDKGDIFFGFNLYRVF
jgi:opacity protein-like surface antigen